MSLPCDEAALSHSDVVTDSAWAVDAKLGHKDTSGGVKGSDTLSAAERESVDDARMNLLCGIVFGSVFTSAALMVAFAEQVFKPSLSEAFEDNTLLPGKLFTVALLLASFSFWVSGYHYKLNNCRVKDPGFERMDWWCRFLRILSNVFFIVVAFVPHIENAQLVTETTGGNTGVAMAFARVHLICGTLSFTVVGISETLVICNNGHLSSQELYWRRISAATLWGCSLMFVINNVNFMIANAVGLPHSLLYHVLRNWSFRFEVCMCCGFMWMNQVVWCFSDPNLMKGGTEPLAKKRFFEFPGVIPYPHIIGVSIVLMDVYRCGTTTQRMGGLALEMLVFLFIITFVYPAFERLFWYRGVPRGTGSFPDTGYGTCSTGACAALHA